MDRFFHRGTIEGLCLICEEAVAVFSEYNISRHYNISHHFNTKHANYASNHSMQERTATAQTLAENLQTQYNILRVKHQGKLSTSNQKSKSKQAFFWRWVFKRVHCIQETTSIVCPKYKFEKSLSRRTVTRHTTRWRRLGLCGQSYVIELFCTALIFIRDINDDFETTEEFWPWSP